MSEIDFQKLAEPFARHEVKSLTKRYQDKKTKEWREYTIRFITARSVMNRLDAVVGPQNWRAEFKTMMLRPDTTAVQCTLFLRIDGEWVGKSDIGTESDIEPEKGAVSDAMKRAAVHWGIGRELYGEGTAYDALGEQRTIDDDGEVTRATSKAAPTTRGERSTHNPPKPSVADELPPAAQEMFPWTHEPGRINKMVAWAREQVWDGIELPHARNRVAKALGCTNFASIAAEYKGTPEQAMAAIQAYVPSDEREGAPAEQPPLEAPTTDKAEPLGQPCADCGEDTMRRAADGTYRCQACADKRARLERAS